MLNSDNPDPVTIEFSAGPTTEATEWYESGIAVRKTGLFQQAIEHFEKATEDPAYVLKAYAQIGLCYKSASQAQQAAGIMVAYEKVLLKETSDLYLLVGDVTSTMACSIAARKLGVPVAFVDSYKILRTQVMHRLHEHSWNVLGVTSPGHGEGKTLTAVNLAVSLAMETTQTVLLVDSDLRSPSIHDVFDL
jgi:Mrp family chromosome partitioning ATPase